MIIVQEPKFEETFPSSKSQVILLTSDSSPSQTIKDQKKDYHKPIVYQNKTVPINSINKKFAKTSRNNTKVKYVYADEVKRDENHTRKTIYNKNHSLPKKEFDYYEINSNTTNAVEKKPKEKINIYNEESNFIYNQNFENASNKTKNILNPVIIIDLDDNKTAGLLNLAGNLNQSQSQTHKKYKEKKQNFAIIDILNNKTFANLENNNKNKSIHILNHNDDINKITNKNLSEELLNSFKKLFSNFAFDKEKSKQTLNLYLNGNISINVLTGNTNPQIITKNIYNKDSYNTNKTISYNIISKNTQNGTISLPNKKEDITEFHQRSSINKINKEFSSKNKIKNLIKNSNMSELSNKINNKKAEAEFKLNDFNKLTKEINEESSENENPQEIDYQEENKIAPSNKNLIPNNNYTNKFLEEKNRKVFELTEDRMQILLQDEELKSFLKKKIEMVNKKKNKENKRINIDHMNKYDKNELSDYFNLKINKTLEQKLMNDDFEYEKKRDSLMKNLKISKTSSKSNGTF